MVDRKRLERLNEGFAELRAGNRGPVATEYGGLGNLKAYILIAETVVSVGLVLFDQLEEIRQALSPLSPQPQEKPKAGPSTTTYKDQVAKGRRKR